MHTSFARVSRYKRRKVALWALYWRLGSDICIQRMQAENIRSNVRQAVGCDIIAFLPDWLLDTALPQAALTEYLRTESATNGAVAGMA